MRITVIVVILQNNKAQSIQGNKSPRKARFWFITQIALNMVRVLKPSRQDPIVIYQALFLLTADFCM